MQPCHGTLYTVNILVLRCRALFSFEVECSNLIPFTGSGRLQQGFSKPAAYYIAVGNLNSEELAVICLNISLSPSKFHPEKVRLSNPEIDLVN